MVNIIIINVCTFVVGWKTLEQVSNTISLMLQLLHNMY